MRTNNRIFILCNTLNILEYSSIETHKLLKYGNGLLRSRAWDSIDVFQRRVTDFRSEQLNASVVYEFTSDVSYHRFSMKLEIFSQKFWTTFNRFRYKSWKYLDWSTKTIWRARGPHQLRWKGAMKKKIELTDTDLARWREASNVYWGSKRAVVK